MKRLIEYDLPLAGISEQSAREKKIRYDHPPICLGIANDNQL
jgi:hypothetical protein